MQVRGRWGFHENGSEQRARRFLLWVRPWKEPTAMQRRAASVPAVLHWKSQHFWSFSLDRQTRKNLKTDKFAEEVFDVFDWASTHKTEMIRYGAILVAVVVIGLGAMFYSRSRAGQREEALANALRIDEATVGGAAPQGGGLHYNSEEEKTKARAQAFAGVAKYN